eukprot:SAG31_NODE_742_length_12424_cov_16.082353_2_plen_206_part_00
MELTFAKQSGVPIVPVRMQGRNSKGREYQASGWLGLITAGTLWVPLWDPKTFDSGVDMLAQQICMMVSDENLDEQLHDGPSILFTLDDVRGELDRLRVTMDDSVDMRTSGANQDGPCRLPAGVPQLPSGLRVSLEMQRLAKKLLSTTSGSKLGFHGMVRSKLALAILCICILVTLENPFARVELVRHASLLGWFNEMMSDCSLIK